MMEKKKSFYSSWSPDWNRVKSGQAKRGDHTIMEQRYVIDPHTLEISPSPHSDWGVPHKEALQSARTRLEARIEQDMKTLNEVNRQLQSFMYERW